MKKSGQNAPGSEKMWFNVLKNEERLAAYQDFLSALGLGQGDTSLDTSKFGEIEQFNKGGEPVSTLTMDVRPGEHDYSFFYSLFDKELSLIVSNEYDPYEDFVFNLFKEEYPQAYKTINQMFIKRAEEIQGTQDATYPDRIKYKRYLGDKGYNVENRDLVVVMDAAYGDTLREMVLLLLVRARNYLLNNHVGFSVLRTPVKSGWITDYTETLRENNLETSLGELIRVLHQTYNHGLLSAYNELGNATREDIYLNLLGHLENEGNIKFKKGMLLLMAMRDEYDDDLSNLFT